MSDSGDGRVVLIEGVGEHGAMIEKAGETAIVLVAKLREVVVPELVDCDGEDKLGPARSLCGQGTGEDQKDRDCEFHVFQLQLIEDDGSGALDLIDGSSRFDGGRVELTSLFLCFVFGASDG